MSAEPATAAAESAAPEIAASAAVPQGGAAPRALAPQDELLWRRFSVLLATVPAVLDDRIRAATGLNHFQFAILDSLARQPERRLQLNAVARETEASLSRLSHSVSKLEAAGYVERVVCDHDRRASWAALTPAGAALVAKAEDEYLAVIHELLLDRVPEQHRATATTLLTTLLPGHVAAECEAADTDLIAPEGHPGLGS